MHVKGSAWLARHEAMGRTFGEARWAAFLETQRARAPFLNTPVMPISRIPVEPFLAVHDALVQEFYGGDTKAFWVFGEASAEWALTHQLRGLFAPHEARRFLQFSPTIYKGYFDGGELVTESTPSAIEIIIRKVEPRHVYFEYSLVGFATGGLRLLECPVTPERLSGFSKGDAEVRYRFSVK